MTRFLLIFTLLTLAVATTTEPAAQSSGTITAPDPEGPQPIRTTTESVPNLLEAVDSGNDTTEANASYTNLAPDPNGPQPPRTTTNSVPIHLQSVNQTSLGTTKGTAVKSAKLKRAKLKNCFRGPKPQPKCFVGSSCLYGQTNEKHPNITKVVASNRTRSSHSKIERCDVGATLKLQANGTFEFGYHTTRDYFDLPLVVEINNKARHFNIIDEQLSCSPYKTCEIKNNTRSVSGSDYYWNGIVTFYTFNKRAELTYCYTHLNSICYFGSSCLNGNSKGVHEKALIAEKQYDLMKFTPAQRKVALDCNVGVVLKPKPGGGFDMEYHSTPENAHLTFTTFSRHPEGRIYRELSIQDGEIHCRPNCRFTRNKTESGTTFWSGEYHLFAFTNKTEEEYYLRKNDAKKSQYEMDVDAMTPVMERRGEGEEEETAMEEEKPNKETSLNLAFILGVCAAAFVVCIVTAVVVIKVIQRREEAKNERKRELIEAKYNQTEAENNRSGPTVSPPTEQDHLLPPTPLPMSGPVSRSAKDKTGTDNESALGSSTYDP